MKIITNIVEDFLEDQHIRLKNGCERYLEVMGLFQDYLNYHTYQLFDDEEMSNLDQKFIEGKKEFCDTFGPDELDPVYFEEFMDYYLIRIVVASKSLIKASGFVLKKFVKWLFKHSYITEEDFQESFEIITGLKA
jgi:hypothetical protein